MNTYLEITEKWIQENLQKAKEDCKKVEIEYKSLKNNDTQYAQDN